MLKYTKGIRQFLIIFSVAILIGLTACQSVYAENAEQELDKRLPPVLPGEQVIRGNTKMKVWSTAGEVAHEAPPCAGSNEHDCNSNSSSGLPSNLSVVVDQRSSAGNDSSTRTPDAAH